ncbi:MAG: hypothetical protein JXA16_14150 [Bacteroidales bacterium]|nr:hypothetical protein [Bacteroidales bacterium]
MKNLSFLIFYSLLNSNIVSCQGINKAVDDFFHYQFIHPGEVNKLSYSEIKGSPYLTDDFVESKIYLSKDSIFSIHLRYNIFNNQIEFQKENEVYAISNPEIFQKIEILNSTFIYYNDKSDSKKNSYYKLLVEGDCYLLAKNRVRFKEQGEEKPYVGASPAEFIRLKDQYLLFLNENSPIAIKNNKSLKNILSDKKDEISDFIKKEKISCQDENDLIKLITYYNKLKQSK